MAKRKTHIEPFRMLVVDVPDYVRISLVVVSDVGSILHMESILNLDDYYFTRLSVISQIDKIIDEYGIDTILFEKNKLFTDKMDRFPDSYVLRNVIFTFGLQVAIEDRYFTRFNIVALPEYEWKKSILGKTNLLSIDLLKSHILKRYDIPIKFLVDIEQNNYYKALCLSESILFGNLMNTKYQINKGVL